MSLSSFLEEAPTFVEAESFCKEKTYFLSGLEEASRMTSMYRESVNTLYQNLSNSVSLEESVNQFINSLDNTILAFQKVVNTQTIDFCNQLIKQTKDHDLIEDNKELLTHYPEHKLFPFKGFIFVNIEPGTVPKPKVIELKYNEDFEKLDSILSNTGSSIGDKMTEIESLTNDLVTTLRGEFYDIFRGKLLKQDRKITKAEYGKALYLAFRKDSFSEVTCSMIANAYDNIHSYRKILDRVKIERDSIIKEYDYIRKSYKNIRFDQMLSKHVEGTTFLEEKFVYFIKVKTDQIFNMSMIHMLAYTAKLDAIANSYLQDKRLLVDCILNIKQSEDSVDEAVVEIIEEDK